MSEKESAALEGPRDGANSKGSNRPLRYNQAPTQGQDLLELKREAGDRVEVNAKLAEWIFDLQARLWRNDAHLLQDDCRAVHHDFEAEIERLKLCISLAKERRP